MRAPIIFAVAAALIIPVSVQAQTAPLPGTHPAWAWTGSFRIVGSGGEVSQYRALLGMFVELRRVFRDFAEERADLEISFVSDWTEDETEVEVTDAPDWTEDEMTVVAIVTAAPPGPSTNPPPPDPVSVPEPATGLMTLSGLIGLGVLRRRRGNV